jgi:hypothetical protein
MENSNPIKTRPISEGSLETAFPGGFNIRDEANAITAYAFRNGALEELHAGKNSPLLDDPSLSRITDEEIKRLMIEASERLEALLRLRETSPEEYKQTITDCALRYCRKWQRNV